MLKWAILGAVAGFSYLVGIYAARTIPLALKVDGVEVAAVFALVYFLCSFVLPALLLALGMQTK